jgi:hypothetical protein
MVEPSVMSALEKKGIPSIDSLEQGSTEIVWFVTAPFAPKKGNKPVTGVKRITKNKKEYVQIFAVGPTGKCVRVSVWGGKELPDPFSLYCAEVKKDDFGASTTTWKMKRLS